MSYSYYEVYNNTLRAFRGMNFPYGSDEDAAYIITYLELYKLDGLKLLANNLDKYDQNFNGTIDYIQMQLWDDFSDDVVLTLMPKSGIERDSRTPTKVMALDGTWDGEWVADVEPGAWVLYASVVSEGIVGIVSVEADVHNGTTVNMTMVKGGTMNIATERVDFTGTPHDLSEISVPGAEIIGSTEIIVSHETMSWNATVDSNGDLSILLPAGDVNFEGQFETTELGMVMDYRAGLSSAIASQQESPSAT